MNNNKVYIVMHKRIESGCEDTFEVMRAFANQNNAKEYANLVSAQIDHEDNDDNGIEEECWVETLMVE